MHDLLERRRGQVVELAAALAPRGDKAPVFEHAEIVRLVRLARP